MLKFRQWVKRQGLTFLAPAGLLILSFILSQRTTSPPTDDAAGKIQTEPSRQTGDELVTGQLAAAPEAAPKPEVTPDDPAFESFADWSRRFAEASGAERSRLIAEGTELAKKRKPLMLELIQSQPQAALETALPRSLRQALPQQVAEHVERWISAEAPLEIINTCFTHVDSTQPMAAEPLMCTHGCEYRAAFIGGQEYEAHVFGSRLGDLSIPATSIHGVALGTHLAVDEARARVLDRDEARQLLDRELTGSEVAVEAMGDALILPSMAAVAEYEAELRKGEDNPVADATPTTLSAAGVNDRPSQAHTTGTKTMLVIRVDYSDLPGVPMSYLTPLTEDKIVELIHEPEGVREFFLQSSFGQTDLFITPTDASGDSPDVTEVLRMPRPVADYQPKNSGLHFQDAFAAATAAGYDIDAYDLLLVVTSRIFDDFLARATRGGKRSVYNGEWSFRTVAHELGHNYGLPHAGLWLVTDGDPISPSGALQEYGDLHDTMGNRGKFNRHFNHWFKNVLWWIPDSSVTTIETSGVYRTHCFDLDGGDLNLDRALKIRRDEDVSYWLGLRQQARQGSMYFPGVNNGAYMLRVNDGPSFSRLQITELLDMQTPGINDTDCSLPVGQTFEDTDAGVRITPIALGGSGPDRWIDIDVDFDQWVQWTSTALSVSEDDRYAELTVERLRGSAGAVSVDYSTANGSAIAPDDYTATSGTLTWADGDSSSRTILIPLVPDPFFESVEDFTVTLSSPVGVMLPEPTATVTVNFSGPSSAGNTMPDVVGMPQATAETTLVAANFQVGTITFTLEPTANPGTVLSQSIGAGLSVVEGAFVDLVVAANIPPVWASDPIVASGGVENVAYSSSLAPLASDGNGDTLTFSKISGPAWLTVAPDGSLSGLPGPSAAGLNQFTVGVTDSFVPAPVEAVLEIEIEDVPPQGTEVYEPFAQLSGPLDGQAPGFGLLGSWQAAASDVLASSLAYGTLPVLSGRLECTGNGGGSVALGSGPASQGLLDDGATLWFSMLVRTGQNDPASLAAISFGSEALVAGDGTTADGFPGDPTTTVRLVASHDFTESWDLATSWSDGNPAGPGKHYLVDGTGGATRIRTFHDVDADLFPGESLTIDGPASNLMLKRGTKTITINQLRMGGGQIICGDGASTFTLAGNLHLFRGSDDGIRIEGNATGDLVIDSTVTGTGRITKIHANELTFSGAASTWAGELELVDGTLLFTYDFAQPLASFTGGGGTFDLNGRSLTFGRGQLSGSPIPVGTYTATDLNNLGLGGTTFTGAGTLEVLFDSTAGPLPLAHSGSGFGVTIDGQTQIAASSWSAGAASSGLAAAIAAENTHLVVGRVEWGADAASPDTLELFLPGPDLLLTAPVSTTTALLDQSLIDRLSYVTTGAGMAIDELRIGSDFRAALGLELPSTDYDVWAADFSAADLTNPAADFDGDGMSNNTERLWGLDPTVASPEGPFVTAIDGDTYSFHYTRRDPALSGATYSYEWSTTLEPGSWTPLTPASEVSDNGTPIETMEVFIDPALISHQRGFVRVVATDGP